MRSIWQKQSGGLFRRECLILLCSVICFCRWSSTFSPALQYLLQYLVMQGIAKPDKARVDVGIDPYKVFIFPF